MRFCKLFFAGPSRRQHPRPNTHARRRDGDKCQVDVPYGGRAGRLSDHGNEVDVASCFEKWQRWFLQLADKLWSLTPDFSLERKPVKKEPR